jgi:diguanylate cyclase (GGDEF)-like protein
LVGVLSLYAELPHPFDDNHRRVLEAVAQQVGRTLNRSGAHPVVDRNDAIVQGPSRFALANDASEKDARGDHLDTERTFILIDVVDLKRINATYGNAIGDEVLRHVTSQIKALLRPGDTLFRHSSDAFIAIVQNASISTATIIGGRIQQSIRESLLTPKDGSSRLAVDIQFTCVSAPVDVDSVTELIALAESRLSAQRRRSATQIH